MSYRPTPGLLVATAFMSGIFVAMLAYDWDGFAYVSGLVALAVVFGLARWGRAE